MPTTRGCSIKGERCAGASSWRPLELHDLWLRTERVGLARTAALSMEVHYCAWVEQSHEPAVTSGDFVVKDKLSSHKVQGVREVIESMGATQRYLPPNSPDCTPMVFASDVIAIQGVILLYQNKK